MLVCAESRPGEPAHVGHEVAVASGRRSRGRTRGTPARSSPGRCTMPVGATRDAPLARRPARSRSRAGWASRRRGSSYWPLSRRRSPASRRRRMVVSSTDLDRRDRASTSMIAPASACHSSANVGREVLLRHLVVVLRALRGVEEAVEDLLPGVAPGGRTVDAAMSRSTDESVGTGSPCCTPPERRDGRRSRRAAAPARATDAAASRLRIVHLRAPVSVVTAPTVPSAAAGGAGVGRLERRAATRRPRHPTCAGA